MPKVLQVAVVSFGALVLSSAIALAQTPPPSGSDPGQTTTSSRSKSHKGGKKSGHRKGGKKKSGKKTPQTPQ
jgi:hypothetical protein